MDPSPEIPGIAGVVPVSTLPHRRIALWLALGVLIVVVAAAAVWWGFFRRAPSPPPGQVVKQLSAAEQPPTFPVGLPPVEEAQLLQNVTVQKA
ncbi:MAG: hypothetical protein HY978_03000, partial [Candidatus Liptonbacteria bacterium]|nr:hypothetical protein [Candidatus Liptonbacteria bacterium]